MEDRLKRFRVILIVLGIAILPVIVRLVDLQLVRGGRSYDLSERNRVRRLFIPAPRGTIYDCRGTVLADVRPAFAISVIPQEATPVSLSRLSRILGLDEVALKKMVGPDVPPSVPVKIKRDIDLTLVTKIEEHAVELTGVIIEVEPWRRYRQGGLFCHVLGHEGEISRAELGGTDGYRLGDYIGRTGIEAVCESRLRGKDGIEYLEVDCQGRALGSLAERKPRPPVPGEDVHLTIDARIQTRAYELIEDIDRAAVVGIEPATGNVVCLVSKPVFDPNLFSSPIASEGRRRLFLDENSPLFNRVLQGRYPPGSTFKPAVVLAAFTAGIVESSTVFGCAGGVNFGGRFFGCWSTHHLLPLKGALVNSCDSYFYQLGKKVGIDRLAAFVRSAGITGPTGIDLPGEGVGFVPDSKWYEKQNGYIPAGAALNLAIGQGEVLVTPLELACFFAAIANDGKRVRPHLLARTGRNGPGSDPAPYEATAAPDASRPFGVSADQIRFLQDALFRVVEQGTGAAARIPGRAVSGKTGTSENPHGEDHAWFVGYVENRILFCVLLENAGMGGAKAAPVVRELIGEYLRLNG